MAQTPLTEAAWLPGPTLLGPGKRPHFNAAPGFSEPRKAEASPGQGRGLRQHSIDSHATSQTGWSDVDEDEKLSLRKSFKPYRNCLLISIVAELLFCYAMSTLAHDSIHSDAEFFQMTEAEKQRAQAISSCYWLVFGICFFTRFALVLVWKSLGKTSKHHAKMTAAYMFFSTVQWMFYVVCYYLMLDTVSSVAWQVRVQSDTNALTAPMLDCLQKHTTLECRAMVNQQVTCREAYTPDLCSGYTFISDSESSQPSKCCNRNVYSVGQQVSHVKGLGIRVDLLFSLLQWMAALSMRWIITQNPMMPALADDPFIKGVTLDILDAVIFGTYLESSRLTFPRYGIIYDPAAERGYAGLTDATMYRIFRSGWCICFALTVLSPVVYTAFKKNLHVTATKKRTFGDAINDAMENVRMLNKHKSLEFVEEAISLQRQQYIKDSMDEHFLHPVTVAPPDADVIASGDLESLVASRPGLAKLTRPGFYHVHYVDTVGPEEEEDVAVSRLQADSTEHEPSPCATGCCQGWCGASQLRESSFDEKAEVMDAIRSFFFLEMPFLIGRLYILHDSLTFDSYNLILIFKNVIWAIMDLFTILSCGNESAKAFGKTPIRSLASLIKGTGFTSVWVGPSGLLSIAQQFAESTTKETIKQKIQALSLHKAWLVVEREKVKHKWNLREADLADYDEDVDSTDDQIKSLEEVLKFTHA